MTCCWQPPWMRISTSPLNDRIGLFEGPRGPRGISLFEWLGWILLRGTLSKGFGLGQVGWSFGRIKCLQLRADFLDLPSSIFLLECPSFVNFALYQLARKIEIGYWQHLLVQHEKNFGCSVLVRKTHVAEDFKTLSLWLIYFDSLKHFGFCDRSFLTCHFAHLQETCLDHRFQFLRSEKEWTSEDCQLEPGLGLRRE